MTQGLHFTMLLSSADTALPADIALSDTDAESGGMVFGEMLAELVQPATNDLNSAKWRQLPADINVLSGISHALAAVTGSADKADSLDSADLEADADATAMLTSSILAQLALKQGNDKAQQPTSELASTDKPAAVTILAAISKPTPEGHLADIDDELANSSVQQLSSILKEAVAKAPVDADKRTAIASVEAGETGADELHPVVNKPGAGTENISASMESMDAAKLRPATVTAPAGEPPAPKAAQALPTAAVSPAASDNASEIDPGHFAQPQVDDVRAIASTKQPLKAMAEVAATRNGEGQQPIAIASLSVTMADIELQTEAKPGADKLVTDEKVANNAGRLTQGSADKAESTGSGKTGSSNTPSQQQGQRQSHGDQSAELQPDSVLAQSSNKAAVETSGLNRQEAVFNQSLQVAEQRQQTSVARAVSKTPAEQLKQSLDLLQQDAAGQLRERVNLMVRQNIQIAEIRLDPAGLGQMQIKIDLQQDQASVQFVVQQPQAKELLEQQLPRLRELLQQQGIMLAEGNVQQQSQQERHLAQRDKSAAQHGRNIEDDIDDIASQSVQISAAVTDRLVDYYA